LNQEIEWERPDKLKKSYIGTTKELKENRAMDKTKYRIILDNMQEGVVVLQNRTTVYSNASMERITGYKKGQIKDKDFLKIIYEDDRQLVIENYMKRLKGETISAYDIRIKPKTGDLRWFMISAIKITWDAKDAVLVYLTDINKRKQAEQALKENENWLQVLLKNVPGGIFQYRFYDDKTVKIEFMSKGAEDLFAKTREELLNPDVLYECIHPEDAESFMESIANAYSDLTPWFTETRIIVNGRIKWVRGVATSKADEDNSVIWNGVLMDITREKEATLALEHNSKLYKTLNTRMHQMLQLDTLEEIYGFITQTLHDQYPDSAVIFASVNKEQTKGRIIKNIGIPKSMISSMLEAVGFDMLNREYNMLPEHYKEYTSGELITFKKGFADFVGSEISHFIARAVEKIIEIPVIHGIGINNDGRLFGIVYFFSKNKNFTADKVYVESFIKQAGIVIERKLLEQELKASEEKFSSFLSRSSDAILLTDEKYNLIYLNRAFEKLVGYEKAEMCGYDVFELNYLLLPDELKKTKSFRQFKEELMKEITSVHAHTHGKLVDTEVKGKHGKICSVQARFFMIRTKEGNRLGAICRDVTDQKEKEKSLQELNATKDRLFSIIGHDLKNPLNSIVGFTQLMNQNFDSYPEEKLKKYIGIIHQSASSLSALLDNLLLWSHAQRQIITVEPVAVSFRKITGKCMDLLRATADKKNIEFQNKLTEKHVGYADSQMMTTVIRNLLANAIKFTPHGGRIVVDGKIQHEKIIVSIQDSGIGIEKEVARNLFNPSAEFSTEGTDGEKGTGLGLIICKEFIEKNHGNIWVESEIGKGAAFFICVPATETVL